MTDGLLPIGDGHTELNEDERRGLIPTYISTRGDLYEAEQNNIARAMLRRRPTIDQLLDDKQLRDLHRAMFCDVWRWAGRYRQRETNLGVDPAEIAVCYHHRLVAIHPFPNGNGRFSRIAADRLVSRLGRDPFSWGSRLNLETEPLRAQYRKALQRADDGDVADLITFARS